MDFIIDFILELSIIVVLFAPIAILTAFVEHTKIGATIMEWIMNKLHLSDYDDD